MQAIHVKLKTLSNYDVSMCDVVSSTAKLHFFFCFITENVAFAFLVTHTNVNKFEFELMIFFSYHIFQMQYIKNEMNFEFLRELCGCWSDSNFFKDKAFN